jgi:hypothetical protein
MIKRWVSGATLLSISPAEQALPTPSCSLAPLPHPGKGGSRPPDEHPAHVAVMGRHLPSWPHVAAPSSGCRTRLRRRHQGQSTDSDPSRSRGGPRELGVATRTSLALAQPAASSARASRTTHHRRRARSQAALSKRRQSFTSLHTRGLNPAGRDRVSPQTRRNHEPTDSKHFRRWYRLRRPRRRPRSCGPGSDTGTPDLHAGAHPTRPLATRGRTRVSRPRTSTLSQGVEGWPRASWSLFTQRSSPLGP